MRCTYTLLQLSLHHRPRPQPPTFSRVTICSSKSLHFPFLLATGWCSPAQLYPAAHTHTRTLCPRNARSPPPHPRFPFIFFVASSFYSPQCTLRSTDVVDRTRLSTALTPPSTAPTAEHSAASPSCNTVMTAVAGVWILHTFPHPRRATISIHVLIPPPEQAS